MRYIASIGEDRISLASTQHKILFMGVSHNVYTIDNRRFVRILELCNAIGLDPGTQIKKIRKRDIVPIYYIRCKSRSGRNRMMLMVTVSSVPTWLETVNKTRASSPARLQAYLDYFLEAFSVPEESIASPAVSDPGVGAGAAPFPSSMGPASLEDSIVEAVHSQRPWEPEALARDLEQALKSDCSSLPFLRILFRAMARLMDEVVSLDSFRASATVDMCGLKAALEGVGHSTGIAMRMAKEANGEALKASDEARTALKEIGDKAMEEWNASKMTPWKETVNPAKYLRDVFRIEIPIHCRLDVEREFQNVARDLGVAIHDLPRHYGGMEPHVLEYPENVLDGWYIRYGTNPARAGWRVNPASPV